MTLDNPVRRRSLPLAAETAPTTPPRSSWRDQARNAITSLAHLERVLPLSETERAATHSLLRAGLPLSITPYYLSLCDPSDPRDPIRLQCVPQSAELESYPGELNDPLGEQAHSPAPNLIQRYPDRALLLVTDRCSVYCRFCTRARMVGQDGGARSEERLRPAIHWLKAHPEVREVIVSGGDPLVMNTARLERVLTLIQSVPHIELIRIGTRAPVVLPMRITPSLCRMLRRFAPLWVMTHFNHPREWTPQARAACERLADHGIPVMNQTVLLRGINDDPSTLEALFRGLVRGRVRPYYLLQGDVMRGTNHFRTPLQRGVEIMAALQGKLSGIALPKFIVDTPAGAGKVHLAPDVIVRTEASQTWLKTFRGEVVAYPEPTQTHVAPANLLSSAEKS
ncbi:MAG: KamA family radical SAM protein [Deltaproteobacteria bacterium]|nr:KamA family radical SAM protein [Deltaproteobacteria bacterium]